MIDKAQSERCPLCCIHGQPLTSWCGWCEDTDGGHMDRFNLNDPEDVEHLRKHYLCPHGKIGGAEVAL